jgi:hypothetical protein
MTELVLEIEGYPPAKGEALSMMGAQHPHSTRVRRLLHSAASLLKGDAESLGSAPIGLEMVLRCPRNHRRGDATNYLGGVGDVLEVKAHRDGLDHLKELAEVALYDNDRQIELIRFRWEDADEPSYRLTIWSLDP